MGILVLIISLLLCAVVSPMLTPPSNSKKPHRRSYRHNLKKDCDQRPSHYGYRYGRWYYGKGHRYGCEPEDRHKH